MLSTEDPGSEENLLGGAGKEREKLWDRVRGYPSSGLKITRRSEAEEESLCLSREKLEQKLHEVETMAAEKQKSESGACVVS